MDYLEKIIENFAHSDWIATGITAFAILLITAVGAYAAKHFMRRLLHFNEEKNLPSSSIFINIARAVIWILGICIMLSICFNVNVSAVVAALGVGGIAVSLGFQDTLSNLIGGLQVSLMRIVKPGDNIEVGSSSGVVKDVSWRHTTIRNSAGAEVIIPNSVISKTALVHLPPINQVVLPIVVITDGKRLDEVAQAIERTAGKAASAVVQLTKQPSVAFSEITDVGFRGSIVFWVADSSLGSRARDAVLRAVAPLTRGEVCKEVGETLKQKYKDPAPGQKDEPTSKGGCSQPAS